MHSYKIIHLYFYRADRRLFYLNDALIAVFAQTLTDFTMQIRFA